MSLSPADQAALDGVVAETQAMLATRQNIVAGLAVDSPELPSAQAQVRRLQGALAEQQAAIAAVT